MKIVRSMVQIESSKLNGNAEQSVHRKDHGDVTGVQVVPSANSSHENCDWMEIMDTWCNNMNSNYVIEIENELPIEVSQHSYYLATSLKSTQYINNVRHNAVTLKHHNEM